MDGGRMVRRRGAWMGVVLLAAMVVSGGCGSQAGSASEAAPTPAVGDAGVAVDAVGDGGADGPGASISRIPTVANLGVTFSAEGDKDVVPTAFVVQFDHDMVTKPGGDLNNATSISIEPKVAGRWSFAATDRLVFRPDDDLSPGQTYKVSIESVGVERAKEGDAGANDVAITKLTPDQPWSHTYTLPDFHFVRMLTPVALSGSKSVQTDLVFSAPVAVEKIQKFIAWKVNGAPVSGATYAPGPHSNVVRATLTDDAFSKEHGYASVDLNLSAGVPLDDGNAHTTVLAPAATAHKAVAFGEAVDVKAVALQEGVNGYYIYVVCDDYSVDGEDVYFNNVFDYHDYEVSRRCTPDVDSARRHIHIEPHVDFDIAPAAAGFQIRGNFDPAHYTVRLEPGLRTIDGGVLAKAVERSFEVGLRSPVVQIVGQGRYIPPEAWHNLAIRHRNVDKIDIEVRHIPRKNMVFWMSGWSEQADQRTANLVGQTTLRVGGKKNAIETSFVDIGDFVGQRKPGVYEVYVHEHDGSGPKSSDTARLLLTNLNLLAKRSAPAPKAKWSDEVFVWALDMHTSKPKGGVNIKLIRKSGYVMARCTTDHSGACRLHVSDKDDDSSPPFAILASKGDDVTYLKYSELQTQVTGADVGGRPYLSANPYVAAVYGDRNLYRPADKVHLVAVLRDDEQHAPKKGLPVEYELFDARGRVVKKGMVETNDAGVVSVDYQLGDISPTGRWRARFLVGKRQVANHDFYVEEFMPERMKVEVQAHQQAFYPEDDPQFGVHARYLFGASAKGSRVELRCRLEPKTFVPPGRSDYKFGPAAFEAPDQHTVDLGKASGTIGDDDNALLSCPEDNLTGSVGGKIVATASVFEAGSGRTTDETASAWLHPTHFYVGLKADEQVVENGKPVTIEGVLVDGRGKPYTKADEVHLEVINLLRNYSWYYDSSRGYYEDRTEWQPLISETKSVAVKDGKFKVRLTPGDLRDGFAVRVRAGKAESTLQLRTRRRYYWSWWWWGRGSNRTPHVKDPSQLPIRGPKTIEVGKRYTIHFRAPYKGRALLTLETHRVLDHAWKEVEPGDNTWSFTLHKRVPNVYATVFLIKDPHQDSKKSFLPGRAFGVKSFSVDRAPYRHKLAVEVPHEVRPNSRLEVVVDAGKLRRPMYVTVAAVDEGILSLNNYETPDLTDQLIAKRALGVTTFDTVGWDVQMPSADSSGPPGGGADDGGANLSGRIMPVKPVALWSGVVKLPKSGRKTVAFHVPNYRGELRVMAIGMSERKVASAAKPVKVRDPLSIQTTTPRFLTAGDTVQIPVFVTNTTAKARKVNVKIAARAIELPGSTFMEKLFSPVSFEKNAKTATIAPGASETFVFQAKTEAISGGAKFTVTASAEGLESTDQTQLPIYPKSPRENLVQSIKLPEGKTDLSQYLKGWMPHSERSSFWVSTLPYGKAFSHLSYLVRYPYGCVEQTSSSTRPMLFLSELLRTSDPQDAYSKPQIDRRVRAGINRLLSMQTSQGGFGYWPGASYPDVWGTTIATHTLIDAQKAGYSVPQGRLDDALDWLRDQVANNEYRWGDGYIEYVLALSGRANKGRIRRAVRSYTGVVTGWQAEQKYLLEAALYLAGDRRYEDDLKHPDIDADSDERWAWHSYYSDFRRRGLELNVFVDLFGRDPAGNKLLKQVATDLSGHELGYYNTQEVTWGVTGLGKWARLGGSGVKSAVLRAGTKTVPKAADNASGVSWSLARAADLDDLELTVHAVHNKASKKLGILGKDSPYDSSGLYLVINSDGVRQHPTVPYGGNGLKLTREYLDADGKPLGKHKVELGDLVYVRLTIRNTNDRATRNIALVDRIGAGFEIENPRLNAANQQDGQPADDLQRFYTSDKWKPDYLDVRDSKIQVFGWLGAGQERQVVYPVRATLAGTFTIPSVHAESMYDHTVWARNKRERITVGGPWASKLVQ